MKQSDPDHARQFERIETTEQWLCPIWSVSTLRTGDASTFCWGGVPHSINLVSKMPCLARIPASIERTIEKNLSDVESIPFLSVS